MNQELEHLYGLKLSATDSEIGKVKDFYFDDQTWMIRYLVADTGNWLSGRQVLLSPHAFGAAALGDASGDAAHLRVNLTRQQIQDSPSLETHRTVSRQYEEEYYRHYGWPNYWDGGMLGAAGFPTFTPEVFQVDRSHHGHNQRDDIHLRSTQAITGYRVQATDGYVGKVQDFVVNGKIWAILGVIIELAQGRGATPLRLLTKHVKSISYETSTMFLNLSQSKLTHAAKSALVQTTHP